MSLNDAVAERINELCNQQNISYNTLGIRSDVSHVTIHDIIVGRGKAPNLSTIRKLCNGFGITLGEFFSTEYFDSLKDQI